MTQDDGSDALPLLSRGELERLRADLDSDDAVWKLFMENFIALLPQRTERLRLTMTTGDLAGALDAVLSLKTASQMIGAERLAALTLDLERSLRDDAGQEPDKILPRLAAAHIKGIIKCGQQTKDLLLKYVS